jgi:4-amino-4-deoxy-L-arabinose transferase-like glycosyltransferase
MQTLRPKKVLGWILLLSVLLRVAVALYLGNEVVVLPGTSDQLSYHNLALRVLAGFGLTFGEPWWPLTAPNTPTAHWSYLYTAYLTLVYKIFGPNPVVARLIQAVVVGLLQPYLAYLLGRRLFTEWVGVLAAGLTAVYLYFIYYAGALMTEPFYITAILATFYMTMRLVDAKRPLAWKGAIGLGLLLGVTVLLRQLFLLFVPFLFLWFLWARYRRNGRWPLVETIIAGGLVVAMILPFTYYNYQRFDRFVLLNTNAGFAFFWGNHPIYGTRFQPILEDGDYIELIPDDLRQSRMDEAALDSELLGRALTIITDDLGRYLLLSLSRVPAYFMFWPSAESGLISNLTRVGSIGLLLPFMLYGLILALYRNWSWRILQQDMALVLLFGLVYTGIHVLSWALIRYRLPVDAVMLVFAGYALVDLAQRFLPARWLPWAEPV